MADEFSPGASDGGILEEFRNYFSQLVVACAAKRQGDLEIHELEKTELAAYDRAKLGPLQDLLGSPSDLKYTIPGSVHYAKALKLCAAVEKSEASDKEKFALLEALSLKWGLGTVFENHIASGYEPFAADPVDSLGFLLNTLGHETVIAEIRGSAIPAEFPLKPGEDAHGGDAAWQSDAAKDYAFYAHIRTPLMAFLKERRVDLAGIFDLEENDLWGAEGSYEAEEDEPGQYPGHPELHQDDAPDEDEVEDEDEIPDEGDLEAAIEAVTEEFRQCKDRQAKVLFMIGFAASEGMLHNFARALALHDVGMKDLEQDPDFGFDILMEVAKQTDQESMISDVEFSYPPTEEDRREYFSMYNSDSEMVESKDINDVGVDELVQGLWEHLKNACRAASLPMPDSEWIAVQDEQLRKFSASLTPELAGALDRPGLENILKGSPDDAGFRNLRRDFQTAAAPDEIKVAFVDSLVARLHILHEFAHCVHALGGEKDYYASPVLGFDIAATVMRRLDDIKSIQQQNFWRLPAKAALKPKAAADSAASGILAEESKETRAPLMPDLNTESGWATLEEYLVEQYNMYLDRIRDDMPDIEPFLKKAEEITKTLPGDDEGHTKAWLLLHDFDDLGRAEKRIAVVLLSYQWGFRLHDLPAYIAEHDLHDEMEADPSVALKALLTLQGRKHALAQIARQIPGEPSP
jgi:hypothetical protein